MCIRDSPGPKRDTWRQFMVSQASSISACDLFTVERPTESLQSGFRAVFAAPRGEPIDYESPQRGKNHPGHLKLATIGPILGTERKQNRAVSLGRAPSELSVALGIEHHQAYRLIVDPGVLADQYRPHGADPGREGLGALQRRDRNQSSGDPSLAKFSDGLRQEIVNTVKVV